LSIHKGTGRWCKKINQRVFYFGKVADDPTGKLALERYLNDRDALLAGRTPGVKPGTCTVEALCNAFMDSKKRLVDSGDLSPRSLDEYHSIARFVAAELGKWRSVEDLTPEDFEKLRATLAASLSHSTVGKRVNLIRVLFNYGFDAGLFPHKVRFGLTFKRPKARLLRLERAAKGSQMIEAAEIRALLEATRNPRLYAMILLGVNAGFGNTDCATLQVEHLDLAGGWYSHIRHKTGTPRRAALWAETVEALRHVIGDRTEGLVFLTKRGNSYAKEIADNPISKEFSKLLRALGIHRPGVGFYGLRRAFETIGGELADQAAVDLAMGHTPKAHDMAAVYRQRIGDDRLRAVAEHVRQWLIGEGVSQ
jgi:integrase